MCVGIEYFLDGERKLVGFDSVRPELAIRRKAGAIAFYRWGTRGPTYYAEDNTPGWAIKFPVGGWAPLDQIRAGEWQRFEPRPVRILVARFLQVDVWQVPRYFALGPGEFVQGLLATLSNDTRVYVVTVPAPAEYADQDWYWPRILPAPNANRVWTGSQR